jgi:hypothetical protein
MEAISAPGTGAFSHLSFQLNWRLSSSQSGRYKFLIFPPTSTSPLFGDSISLAVYYPLFDAYIINGFVLRVADSFPGCYHNVSSVILQ